MTQEKCIWCGRREGSLREIEVSLADRFGFHPKPKKFSVCSPPCEHNFQKYAAHYNRYGKLVYTAFLVLLVALLMTIILSPSIPELNNPKIWGGLIILIGLLALTVPMAGAEPNWFYPVGPIWGIRHAGVRGFYWRARISGAVVLLVGIAVFFGWIPPFPKERSS